MKQRLRSGGNEVPGSARQLLALRPTVKHLYGVTDAYGFPKQHKDRRGSFLGYRTGDIVKAITPKGTLQGRIAIRYRPWFRLGKRDIHPKYLRRLHRVDGYEYTYERSA